MFSSPPACSVIENMHGAYIPKNKKHTIKTKSFILLSGPMYCLGISLLITKKFNMNCFRMEEDLNSSTPMSIDEDSSRIAIEEICKEIVEEAVFMCIQGLCSEKKKKKNIDDIIASAVSDLSLFIEKQPTLSRKKRKSIDDIVKMAIQDNEILTNDVENEDFVNSKRRKSLDEHNTRKSGISKSVDALVLNVIKDKSLFEDQMDIVSSKPAHEIEEKIIKGLGQHILTFDFQVETIMHYPRGLINTSNWCFANAILQALLVCPSFFKLMRTLPTTLAEINGLKTIVPIFSRMAEFVGKFSVLDYSGSLDTSLIGNKENSFDPYSIHEMLEVKSAFRLKAGQQQDAEEFLTCLLDGLSHDMRFLVNFASSYQETQGIEEFPYSVKYKDCNIEGTKTPVQHMLLGKTRSCITTEHGESVTFQVFQSIQLEITSSKISSISDAMTEHFRSENLEGYVSPFTNEITRASKHMEIESLPPILILHLKRFTHDQSAVDDFVKNSKQIEFELQLVIDGTMLSPDCKQVNDRNYRLIAIVHHKGNQASNGHYISDIFHPVLKTWIRCDDGILMPRDEKSVTDPSAYNTAYLLFYQRSENIHTKNNNNVMSRTFQTPLKNSCSVDCPDQKCLDTQSENVDFIKSKLQSMKPSQIHDFLLQRLALQKDVGKDCKSITINNSTFCFQSFCEIFGISNYLINKIEKEHKAGIVSFTHGNSGNLYSSPLRDKAIAFILQFAKVFSENLPDRECLRLPSYITKKFIYNQYKEQYKNEKIVSESAFYSNFKAFFGDNYRFSTTLPRIIFLPRHSHPVCTHCDRLSHLKANARNKNEVDYALSRKKKHMNEIRDKYLKFCDRRESSIRYPSDYLHVGVDDMEQRKIESPYFPTVTKELSNLLKLNNHLTGMLKF